MNKIYLLIFINLTIFLNAKEVHIEADHFHASDILKVAYFEGNAKIEEGTNRFSASKISVHMY